MKKLKFAGAIFAAVLTVGNMASAATVTNDVIFGTGNSNHGFTVETEGSLELGLRAKLRYGPSGANDALGVGIIQNVAGDYLFDSNISSAPANKAMWNFDWTINSNFDGNGGNLNTYSYAIGIDLDPTAATNMLSGDPIGPLSDAAFGDNSTGNGAGTVGFAPLLAFSNNIAQNSSNYGFALPFTFFALGDGLYTVSLSAFDGGTLVSSVSINVIVAPAAVPLPAGLPLLVVALGGLGLIRRRKI